MHPSVHAEAQGDKPALIMAGSGETVTYSQLDRRSNRAAHLFRSRGLEIGDTIAICMENQLHYFDMVWGAQRAGLVYVAISNRLTAPEIAYILKDSGAKLLVTSTSMAHLLDELQQQAPDVEQLVFGRDGDDDADAIFRTMPDTPIADERGGVDMLYSSGTTGKPKGIRLPLPEDPDIAATNALLMLCVGAFGLNGDAVYLSPAPLYHAAPLRWCMAIHKLGGTVIVMEKFDPEHALQLIEKYKVTDSQWVPTHFVRMLKLPEEVRAKYDVSSLKCAVHAAAPCPIPIKEAMIDWWGPVIYEYYAGTEGNGFTFLKSEEWLAHKGSVGKSLLGTIRICDEEGDEVPVGEEGQIFFEGGGAFTYHNDPEKTKSAANKHGWTSLGDVGKVDEEGYLYLTDRKSFMIISGGVNIYPQEIENLLVTHEKVADAAVIGAPDPDFGEKVVAVVQPLNPAHAGEALADELHAFMEQSLSRVKMPKQIDFREELPRHATGKLYKRLLRDEYWGKSDSKIVA
ncbi:acyl-CoA synthetase [Alterisphingorhabdus coralli]|uniref:Acyl-CoA synthetase n=1 Tax=Alterisphingorhabdus coralli TaxID=3071408 RepID=A0AA97FAA7_9SPHN|nr:acyl-CoA synthetase [Parasphingorhabdus sp. SCSIO 66989]WOE76043.1 acyl-CoA synthetase [Parasphingorhabdus sp. SCSIO 66989]